MLDPGFMPLEMWLPAVLLASASILLSGLALLFAGKTELIAPPARESEVIMNYTWVKPALEEADAIIRELNKSWGGKLEGVEQPVTTYSSGYPYNYAIYLLLAGKSNRHYQDLKVLHRKLADFWNSIFQMRELDLLSHSFWKRQDGMRLLTEGRLYRDLFEPIDMAMLHNPESQEYYQPLYFQRLEELCATTSMFKAATKQEFLKKLVCARTFQHNASQEAERQELVSKLVGARAFQQTASQTVLRQPKLETEAVQLS